MHLRVAHLLILTALPAVTPGAAGSGASIHRPREAPVSAMAKGTFEVKLAQLAPYDATSTQVGRMSIDKTFHGDLEATSRGEMVAAMTATKGSAGYVAIETVTGSLHGKSGSFVLQHSSTMARGVPTQSVTVVPDSGTDGLIGLAGSMVIIIKDGKHFYEFEYTLTPAP